MPGCKATGKSSRGLCPGLSLLSLSPVLHGALQSDRSCVHVEVDISQAQVGLKVNC